MARLISLFVWLLTLGLQLEIIVCQKAFDRPLVGPMEDFLLFFGAVPVQALFIVLWFVSEDRAVHEEVSEQICRERTAEVGHTSELEEVRGHSLRVIATSLRDRISLSLRVYFRVVRPFLVAGLMLLGLALLISIS